MKQTRLGFTFIALGATGLLWSTALADNPLTITDLAVEQLHAGYNDTPHRYRLTLTVAGGTPPLSHQWRVDCGSVTASADGYSATWQYDTPGECAAAKAGILVTDAAGQRIRLVQSVFNPADRQVTPFTFTPRPAATSAAGPAATLSDTIATTAVSTSEQADSRPPWYLLAAAIGIALGTVGAVMTLKKTARPDDDCEAAAKKLIADIQRLRNRYEDYEDNQRKQLSALEQRDHELDAATIWNRWRNHFGSFLQEFAVFRDIKNASGKPVLESPGLWDLLNETLGDTLGTMISMTAEEVAQLTISTDTIKAVEGMYQIFKEMVDTRTAGGAAVVLTGAPDTLTGTDIMEAVQNAPRTMEETLKTYNQAGVPFVTKYGEFTRALEPYRNCATGLPEFPVRDKHLRGITGSCPARRTALAAKLKQVQEFAAKHMNSCSGAGLEDQLNELELLKQTLEESIPPMDDARVKLRQHRRLLREFFER